MVSPLAYIFINNDRIPSSPRLCSTLTMSLSENSSLFKDVCGYFCVFSLTCNGYVCPDVIKIEEKWAADGSHTLLPEVTLLLSNLIANAALQVCEF